MGPKLTRRVLEEQIEHLLQKKVEVGQSGINIFGGFGVEYKNVRIVGTEGEEFFRADAFVLKPWIQSLILGRLRWKSLILKSPSIRATRSSDGRIDFYHKGGKGPKGTGTEIFQGLKDIATLLPTRIIIRGGRISFTDLAVSEKPVVTEIEAVELSAEDISSAKPLSFELSGRFTGDLKETFAISGQISLPREPSNPKPMEFAISLKADGVNSQRIWPYVRKAAPFQEIGGRLDLKVKHRGGLKAFHSSGEMVIRNGRIGIPSLYTAPIEPSEVALAYDLEFGNEEIYASSVSVRTPSASFHGTVLIEKSTSPNPYVSIDLKSGRSSLKAITPFLPDRLVPKKLLSFLTDAGIRGSVEIEEARLDGPWDKINSEGLHKNPEMLSLRMHMDKWSFFLDPKFPILRNVSGTVTVRGDQVAIEGFHAQFLQTRLVDLSGSISRVFSRPRIALAYEADVDLKGLASLLKANKTPEKIRRALDPISKVSGRANMAGTIRYLFNKPTGLTYKGKVTLKRGRLAIAGIPPLTDLEGEIRYDEKEILLSHLKWRIGKGVYQGKASILGYLTKLKNRLTLSKRMRISFDLGAEEIHFDRFFPAGRKKRDIQIDPKSIWVNSTVTGKMRISRGWLRGVHLGNLKATFVLKRGLLRFRRLQAEAPGGFFRCRGWVNLRRKPGLSFKLIPEIHHLSMTEVIPIFLDHQKEPMITGKLDLDGIITGRGGSAEGIRKSLSGDLRVRVGEGRIHGLEGFKGDELSYNRATGQIAIQGGVASTRDLSLDSDAMSMAIKGQADLNNQRLDLSIGVRPLQKTDKVLSNVPLAGWLLAGRDRSILTFGFRVRGTFNELRVEPRETRTEENP